MYRRTLYKTRITINTSTVPNRTYRVLIEDYQHLDNHPRTRHYLTNYNSLWRLLSCMRRMGFEIDSQYMAYGHWNGVKVY